MKRPFLILLSLAATVGFGTWLVRTPNTQREILLACAGWVLGFWAAAAIQSRGQRPIRGEGRARGRHRGDGDAAWPDDGEDPDDWDDDEEDDREVEEDDLR